MEAPKENLRGLAEAVPEGAMHGSLFSDVDVYDADVVVLNGLAVWTNSSPRHAPRQGRST